MHTRSFSSLAFVLLALVASPVLAAHAGEDEGPHSGTFWDSAVNSLLSTGMYGFDAQGLSGLTVQFQHAQQVGRPLEADQVRQRGQAITFSYEGSAGLLGFSAGYILTSQRGGQEPGTVFLGLDPTEGRTFDPTRSWYMAFDLSRSYQVDEAIHFQMGSRAILLQNPFDTEAGRIFSMLFNMPISYKNYLTITPELQWSRPLSGDSPAAATTPGNTGDKRGEDVFYGGISISFSY